MIRCSDCGFESEHTTPNFCCLKCYSDRVFLIEEIEK